MSTTAISIEDQRQLSNQHPPKTDDGSPWYFRILVKGFGVFAGGTAMLFAGLGLFTLSATCLIAVFLQL